MTISEPVKRPLGAIQGMAVGVVLTLITLASSWMLMGKAWLQASGENTRQIVVNTSRLAALESDRITRAEHSELIARVAVLEMAVPSRNELDARDRSKDVLLQSLTAQVHDLTLQVGALRQQVSSLQGMLDESLRREWEKK